MRISTLLLALMLSAFAPAHAESRVDVGATIVNGDLRGFYLAIGEYFRVPEREVVVIRDRHLPHHEVPVALYIAQHAHVDPSVVVDLRLGGHSWMDITLHFGLHPDIYYVPVQKRYGPPYGRAYGYYKNKPRKDWHKIKLADDEVVNLVNLRFISEHYHYAPDDVARLRSSGKDYVVINRELQRDRSRYRMERRDGDERGRDRLERRDDDGRGKAGPGRRDDDRGNRGHGNGKDKDKDKQQKKWKDD